MPSGLKTWRESQQPPLTQAELGERIGVTQQTVGRYELEPDHRDYRRPTYETLDRLIEISDGAVTRAEFPPRILGARAPASEIGT